MSHVTFQHGRPPLKLDLNVNQAQQLNVQQVGTVLLVLDRFQISCSSKVDLASLFSVLHPSLGIPIHGISWLRRPNWAFRRYQITIWSSVEVYHSPTPIRSPKYAFCSKKHVYPRSNCVRLHQFPSSERLLHFGVTTSSIAWNHRYVIH